MNFEIERENWTNFFDTLGKRRYDWSTKIEILNDKTGSQVLTDGLPLNGITVETKGEGTTIDISVGEGTEAHQTHNIKDPIKVELLAAGDDRDDVIEIEERNGTKTLIAFIRPMGILVGYTEVEMVATAS